MFRPSLLPVAVLLAASAIGQGTPTRPTAPAWGPGGITPAALGDRMDRSLLQMGQWTAESTVFLENVGTENLRGQVKANVFVRDARTYFIEYILPGAPTYVNRFVADGRNRRQMERGKWGPRIPAGSPAAVQKVTLASWRADFPRHAFRAVHDRRPMWGPLFRDIAAQKGLRTTVQRRVVQSKGRSWTRYRLTATRPGARQPEIEVLVDGTYYLPLTIRIVRNAGGKEQVSQWSARYKFGQRHDSKQFRLP